MIPPIYQTLTAAAPVTSIVGTRIYGSGNVPEGEPRPYVTWLIASAAPENNLSDTPEFDDQRVQIDCWSKDETQCRQLATAVRNAIEAQVNITFGPWNDYEAETRLFRWSMDCTWFLDR